MPKILKQMNQKKNLKKNSIDDYQELLESLSDSRDREVDCIVDLTEGPDSVWFDGSRLQENYEQLENFFEMYFEKMQNSTDESSDDEIAKQIAEAIYSGMVKSYQRIYEEGPQNAEVMGTAMSRMVATHLREINAIPEEETEEEEETEVVEQPVAQKNVNITVN